LCSVCTIKQVKDAHLGLTGGPSRRTVNVPNR
jgi:hypothetical protein